MADLVSKKGWSKSTLAAFKSGRKGVNCTSMAEGIPKYAKAPCEEVIAEGQNNAWIIVGRDRPTTEESGYGGKGASHCGMISLVAGRMGQKAADLDSQNNEIYAEPSHRTDAAFIYISQKTDIDENLKLVDGKVGKMEAKSGIGIKADNLRLVARQGIKLVTGTDEKLSTDSASIATYGIDLIAGNNDEDIQPIVKGENLLNCLISLKKEIAKLNGAFVGFLQYQLEFNMAAMAHYHITTIPMMPTTPTIATPGDPLGTIGTSTIQRQITRTLRTLANQKANLNILHQKYLIEGHAKDGKTSFINSKHNNVN